MTTLSADKVLLLFELFAFAWGAVWGSFLNVVIHRLPRRMSLTRPASHCPNCERPIRFYDNIPLLSFLVLRGRCRSCKTAISWRYPLIELLTASFSLWLFVKVAHGRFPDESLPVLLLPFLFYFFFLAALIAITFIDLDTTEIPPSITLPGIALGIAAAALIPKSGSLLTFTPAVTVESALLGAAIGGGAIFLLIAVYYILTRRAGMGGGDIWMMAMCGAFLGWQSLIFLLFASSLQGVVASAVAYGVERLRKAPARGQRFFREGTEWQNPPSSPAASNSAQDKGEEPETAATGFGKLAVPYGPFIALAAVEYVFFGHLLLPLLTAGLLYPGVYIE